MRNNAALDEPGMPLGRVVGYEVEQDLEPAHMNGGATVALR